MKSFLSTLLNIAVLTFAVTSMLSVGFGHTIREIVDPLRHPHGVIRALLANFLLVPLLAAGAPFLIKLTQHAEHDLGLSATLLVLLFPTTALFMPMVVPLVVPAASVSAWSTEMPLLLTMALPLGIGLFVRGRFPVWAETLRPGLGRTLSIVLVVLVVATFLANLRGIRKLAGTGAILGACLLTTGAFLIGYALVGRDLEIRGALGLATGQRNISAATVVAAQGFDDPGVLVMVVISSLVGLALLLPAARILRWRLAWHTAAETGSDVENN